MSCAHFLSSLTNIFFISSQKVSPKHVEIWNEIHEPLRINRHQVDDLADRAVLLRCAVHAKGFAVDGRDETRPQVHAHHKHLLEVLRQENALKKKNNKFFKN